jgi:hypothetical protein
MSACFLHCVSMRACLPVFLCGLASGMQSVDDRFEAQVLSTDARSQRVRIVGTEGGPHELTWGEVTALWRSDPEFARFYSSVLAASPFPSFLWECPPTTAASSKALFEHTTVQSPRKFRSANPASFAKYLFGAVGRVTSFPNRGGDATLVVPHEEGPRGQYGHLAAFVRLASAEQQIAFWAEVGASLQRVVEQRGTEPTWLSTAGMGVSWLHARLDAQPKYYRTQRYKAWPPLGSDAEAPISRREIRRRRVRAAAVYARRAVETEDASAEGNWPADGEVLRRDL